MIAEFLEVTFSRHGTCKLLYDTSLALARSSPTRRYTGHIQLQDVRVQCAVTPAMICPDPPLCGLADGGARPVPHVLLDVGGGCVTVPRGGPRPAARRRRPVGTLTQHAADGIIRCIVQTCAVRTQHDRRGVLMFHSRDRRNCVSRFT